MAIITAQTFDPLMPHGTDTLVPLGAGLSVTFVVVACMFRVIHGSPGSQLRSYLESLENMRMATDLTLSALTGRDMLRAAVATYLQRSVKVHLAVTACVLIPIYGAIYAVRVLDPTLVRLNTSLDAGLEPMLMLIVAWFASLHVHLNAELIELQSVLSWRRYFTLRFPTLVAVQPAVQFKAIRMVTLLVTPAWGLVLIAFEIATRLNIELGLFRSWILACVIVIIMQVVLRGYLAKNLSAAMEEAEGEFGQIIATKAASAKSG